MNERELITEPQATLTATEVVISQELQVLWNKVAWTAKMLQKRFVEAYCLTLDKSLPGYKVTWKTDPHFFTALTKIEDYIKNLCCNNPKNPMPGSVWKRYLNAARKVALMDVDFSLASQNYTLKDLQKIQANPEAAKEIRQEKRQTMGESIVKQYSTILPLPSEAEGEAQDYIATLTSKLEEHLRIVKEKYGEEAVKQILENLK